MEALLLILLIAAAVLTLKVGLEKGKEPKSEQTKISRKNLALVAREYPILYWYAAIFTLDDVITTGLQFTVLRPWKAITPQYITQHHLHHTVYFLQMQAKFIGLAVVAVLLALRICLIVSKSFKAVNALMWVFLLYDALGVLDVIGTGASTYHMIVSVIGLMFTFLVFWSLKLREPDFWKMLRVLGRS